MVFPPRSPEADKPAACRDCGKPVSRYWNGGAMPCEDKACKEAKRDAEARACVARNVEAVRAEIAEHFRGAAEGDLDIKLPTYGSAIFFGPVGRGKTHAAAAYSLKLAGDFLVRTAHWTSVPMLLLRIRNTFDKKGRERELDIVEELVAKDLLVLDDLGAEKVTDFSTTVLYTIVSERMNRNGKVTIVTTNLSMAELSGFDARLFSRMSSWHRVKVDGADRRHGGDRRSAT